jgi:hypothetical protein
MIGRAIPGVMGASAIVMTCLLVFASPVSAQVDPTLYQEACSEWDFAACNILGLMYETGEGVERDRARAAEYYERACVGRWMVGCTNLGRLYQAGEGVEQNDRAAEELFHRACMAGEGFACDILDTTPRALLEEAGIQVIDLSGTIIGRVTDEAGRRGVQEVSVLFAGDARKQTITDRSGEFILIDLPPGLATLEFSRLGYQTRTVELNVRGGRTTEVEAAMSVQPIELDPIEVVVRSKFLERNGYYRREQQGFGTHFQRRDLEELNLVHLSRLFYRIPGARVQYDRYGGAIIAGRQSFGRRTCAMQVYLDGLPMFPPFDIDQIMPEMVEAIEVYRGPQAPIQYRNSLNACGTILIWTR